MEPFRLFATFILFFHISEFLLAAKYNRNELSYRCECVRTLSCHITKPIRLLMYSCLKSTFCRFLWSYLAHSPADHQVLLRRHGSRLHRIPCRKVLLAQLEGNCKFNFRCATSKQLYKRFDFYLGKTVLFPPMLQWVCYVGLAMVITGEFIRKVAMVRV
jgi:hypothetical protein